MQCDILEMGRRAKAVKAELARMGVQKKNELLTSIADALTVNEDKILAANQTDLENAEHNGVPKPMLDRLKLTPQRIRGIADSVREVARLEDPVGRVEEGFIRPNGLRIEKVRVPMGVIGMIYEARPNVTVDAAVLCLKAGSAVILRGGKEAFHSSSALVQVMRKAIAACGAPEDLVQLVGDTSRESATQMMRLNGYIDVLIPRGGAGLIRSVVENATVPVIETGTGNCHIYVDASADLEMAAAITDNAKTSRPSVCNAAESLLVHKDVAEAFLPMVKERLDQSHVTLHGCPETVRILGAEVVPATQEDYAKEYLDYQMSIKVVSDLDEAIAHIARYSTGHSECIVTRNLESAQRFTDEVDSAAVYVNASTRFTDGGEFGLGAEIGISTQKLHARGPLGLRELTATKFRVYGNGQIR